MILNLDFLTFQQIQAIVLYWYHMQEDALDSAYLQCQLAVFVKINNNYGPSIQGILSGMCYREDP